MSADAAITPEPAASASLMAPMSDNDGDEMGGQSIKPPFAPAVLIGTTYVYENGSRANAADGSFISGPDDHYAQVFNDHRAEAIQPATPPAGATSDSPSPEFMPPISGDPAAATPVMTPPSEDGVGGPGMPPTIPQQQAPMMPPMPQMEGAPAQQPQPPMDAQMGGALSVPQPNPMMPQQAPQTSMPQTPNAPSVPLPKTTNKPHKSTKGISKNPKTAKKLSIMKSVIGKVNTSNAYKPTGKTRKPVF
jgi:hypothetical protein